MPSPQPPVDFCGHGHHAYDRRGQCVTCGHWRDGSTLVVVARVTTEADAHELADRLATIATREFLSALVLALDAPDDPTPEETRLLALRGVA